MVGEDSPLWTIGGDGCSVSVRETTNSRPSSNSRDGGSRRDGRGGGGREEEPVSQKRQIGHVVSANELQGEGVVVPEDAREDLSGR